MTKQTQAQQLVVGKTYEVVMDGHPYKGTIVPPFDWWAPSCVGMTTEISWFPIRMVDLRNVSRVVLVNGKKKTVVGIDKPEEAKIGKTWQIESSKGGTFYTVTNEGKHWTCSCAAFTYRRSCKHINMAMQNPSRKIVKVKKIGKRR